MLKYQVEAIPEGMEQFYQEKDGKFVLAVEGLPQPEDKTAEITTLKTKLDEFRNNNRELYTKLQKLEGVDNSAQLDELVKQAVAANTQKLTAIEQEKATLMAQLEEVIVSDKIKEAAVRYGVAETALQDVLNRAKLTFTVKDGKPLPKNGAVDGDGNVLSPDAWVKALAVEAPHLFSPSVGAGARRPIGGGVNNSQSSSREKVAAGLAEIFGKK